MKTALVAAIVLGSIAGVGGRLILRGEDNSTPAAPEQKASPYWPDAVAANGIVEGARPEVALRPEFTGQLAVLHVKENAQVTEGALLAELRNDAQKHQVALSKAEIESAQAELDKIINGERQEKRDAAAAIESAKHTAHDQAMEDYTRSNQLASSHAVSRETLAAHYYAMKRTKAEWEEAKANLALINAPARPEDVAAGQAKLDAAKARLKLAQADLDKTYVRAPSSGRILQIFIEPGEMAGPRTAQPVLLLADLSKRRVRAFVEELDISRVREGQTAKITADGMPGKDFMGKVAVVLPRMGKRSPQSDAPGEYKDLYFREVLIDLAEGSDLPTNLRVQSHIHTESNAEAAR